MRDTSNGWRVWPSKKGNMRVSDMTDSHIKACIGKLSATYGSGYNYRQQWIEIFETELKERAYERNRIQVSIPPGSSDVAGIYIGLSRIPKHCGECPFYEASATFDEDALFGDGITHCCPFGANSFGCLVKRPNDCPLKLKRG